MPGAAEPDPAPPVANRGDGPPVSLDVLALDVVRRVRSQLADAPTAALTSWEVDGAVVILLRYRRLRSGGLRSAWIAQRHHLELISGIRAAVGHLAGGRLELLGSSFSPHRCLSALAFAVPGERRSCRQSASPDAHPGGALPAAE